MWLLRSVLWRLVVFFCMTSIERIDSDKTLTADLISTLLIGWQEGYPACRKQTFVPAIAKKVVLWTRPEISSLPEEEKTKVVRGRGIRVMCCVCLVIVRARDKMRRGTDLNGDNLRISRTYLWISDHCRVTARVRAGLWPSVHKCLRWRYCLETVFSAITSVNFRRRSKRIAFLESVNFYTYVCMKIFDFCDGHVITFRHPSGACILPNAWSQTFQTSKRHIFRVSAFHSRFG